MKIDERNVTELVPYVNNARTHSDDQVKQIMASIQEFGFTNPILVDERSSIIAGHGRLMAAQRLGLKDVPTITLEGLSEAQKKAYILADNKMALNAGWDDDLLKIEIGSLLEMDFDPSLTGFSSDELDDILGQDDPPPGLTDEDDVPDVPEIPASNVGDVWVCGNHRVMCGDAISIDDVEKLMNGQKADMSFTSPPYNVGHNVGYEDKCVESQSKYIHGDDLPDYVDLIVNSTRIAMNYANDVFVNLQFLANNKRDIIKWLYDLSEQFKDIFFWKKRSVAPVIAHNVANSQVELICLFSGGNKSRAWGNKKFRGNFSNHIETSSASKCNGNADVHNATFPVDLPETFIEAGYKQGSLLLDLFCGTGTMIIAADNHGCICYGMELEPVYVDVIVKRWQDYTGQSAILESTGQSFSEVSNGK